MKRMKKLFAILMTMAMVMGLSITGFAAEKSATITIDMQEKMQNSIMYRLWLLIQKLKRAGILLMIMWMNLLELMLFKDWMSKQF